MALPLARDLSTMGVRVVTIAPGKKFYFLPIFTYFLPMR
jgi:hypothetical protein